MRRVIVLQIEGDSNTMGKRTFKVYEGNGHGTRVGTWSEAQLNSALLMGQVVISDGVVRTPCGMRRVSACVLNVSQGV